MQRDSKVRRNQRMTPDVNSSPKISKGGKKRQTKMDPTVSQSNDEMISRMMSDNMPGPSDLDLNIDRELLESAGGLSVMSPSPAATGRNNKGNRTMQNSKMLESIQDPLSQYEVNLRQSLISKFNTFMPAHKKD